MHNIDTPSISRRSLHAAVLAAGTVSGVTKIVDGVRAVGVLDQDFDAGQLTQYSVDWLAEDHQGAVWSMGTYTENYEGGHDHRGRSCRR